MYTIEDAFKELKTIDISEANSLIKDLSKNKDVNYSKGDQVANYGDLNGFLDMIGNNENHKPRILSNYRNNSADADRNGQHICFTTDIFNEPRVMPQLDFGLVFDKDKLEAIAKAQGWTELISYDDLFARMAPDKVYKASEKSNLLKGSATHFHGKMRDWKDREYQGASINVVRIKGIACLSENDSLKYYLQLYQYSWREIQKELYEYLRDKIEKLPEEYKKEKDLSVIPNGPFYVNSGDERKAKKNIYAHIYQELKINTSNLKEAYIFGVLDDVDDELNDHINGKDFVAKGRKNYGSVLRVQDKESTADCLNLSPTTEIDKQMIDNLLTTFQENELRLYREDPDERYDLRRRYLNLDYRDILYLAFPKVFKESSATINLEDFWHYLSAHNEELHESASENQIKINFNSDNITWWNNDHAEIGADESNALYDLNQSETSHKWARVRGCMLLITYDSSGIPYVAIIHNDNGSIDLPGGGLDPKDGYDTAKAAVREAKEEIGVSNITNIEYVASDLKTFDSNWVSNNVPKEWQWRDYYSDIYIGECLDPNTMKKTGDEQYEWLALWDAIHDPRFRKNPSWVRALKNYMAKNNVEDDLPEEESNIKYIVNKFFSNVKYRKNDEKLSELIYNFNRLYWITKMYSLEIKWYDKY